MSELVSTLISDISSDREMQTLQQLNTVLATKTSKSGHFDLEDELTDISSLGNENPFPKASPESICQTQLELNKFTCYLFDRRFGWSETDREDGRRVRRLSSTGVTMSAGTSQQKAILNTLLDYFMKWYMHQELSLPILLALNYTIKQAASMPVVRNRAVIHFMDWCKHNCEQLCDDSLYNTIQDLVLMSVTDVWSAIRNACASRLSPIALSLDLQQIHSLFDCFVKVCSDESSWQSQEGAIMGINAVLQRFLNRSCGKSPMSSPRTLDTETEEKNVPDFISDHLRSVVFRLLSHSQLTIREYAAKTLATYITCSSVKEALATLHEVVAILKRGKESYSNNNTQVFHGQFLDDYASEGFIGVCIFLVKVIPLNYLLPSWPEYISTFLLYISHPASTVRQAASNVFKYLVVKSSHSVVVLKLILQALAMGWNPDTDSMTAEISQDSTAVGKPLPSVCDYEGNNLSDTWEGREGRLFAYELIFKYLIKNHWLYTFGPAGSGTQMEVSKENSTNGCENDLYKENNVDHNQTNPATRVMPHVESEKSLAFVKRRNWRQVRFLSQTEISHSPSESHVTHQLERMFTMDHSDPQLSSPRSHGTVGSKFDNLHSLLTQAQIVDSNYTDTVDGTQSHLKQELQLNKLRKLLENINKNSSVGCKCGWMEKEYLQDMSRILKVVLYQTAESLGHSQWELRRIANQVLPCLAEVIRWYDINLLVSIWNSYLNAPVPTCLMTFTSVLLLKESVMHAIRLVALLHKPPHTWQNYERCRECLSSITSTIHQRLPAYLPNLEQLIRRECLDRLSILAADVILVAYGHFGIISDEKLAQYVSVLWLWQKIFQHAHPQTRISTELLHSQHTEVFVSPFEGYLSCCLVKPDNKLQCAKQVEKLLVSEIYHKLTIFLDSLHTTDVMSVAPILAHYIGLFVEDSHMCKAVLDSLHCNVVGITKYTQEQTDRDVKQKYLRCVLITLKELSALIAMKSLDLPQLQKVLLIYEELCKPVQNSKHLAVVLSAISARLNETVKFSVDNSPRPGYDGDDLYLMSNDIPRSYSPEIDDDSDSEEVIVGTPSSNRFPESLTLNSSNNSGSLTGRLSALSESGDSNSTPREESDSEEEESSDWDSWDEEDEGLSAFSEVFTEFLQKLQKSNSGEFIMEVRNLGDRERSVIMSLLKS